MYFCGMHAGTSTISTSYKTVILIATPGTRLLDIAGPADVFSLTTEVLKQLPDGVSAGYKLIVASSSESTIVESKSEVKVICEAVAAEIQFEIDTLLICGGGLSTMHRITDRFFDWLKNMSGDIRRIGSVCVGAFVLAKAGLLEGKRATTHWEYCDKLQADYPSIIVDSSPFFVRDENVYTSGGITSGMDLALALVEEDFGRDVALLVARRLVLHLKRPGSQAQFRYLLPAYEMTSPLVRDTRQWLLANLSKEVTVDQMAEHVNMSPRNFARVFLRETEHTPAKFVEKLRVEVARQYLENTILGAEQIAEKCGFGSLVSMRRVFLRHLQISPSMYRHAFRTSLPEEMYEV